MAAAPKPRAGHLTEAQRLGAALRRLRMRYDLTQQAAAERANTRQQTWQRYEAGGNDALLKVTLQRRLAEAVGSDHEEFLLELAGINAPAQKRPNALAEREQQRPFEVGVVARVGALPGGYDADDMATIDLSTFLGDDVRVMQVAGESMVPYAEPGGFVTYHLKRYPRRGQGCVIELADGSYVFGKYERIDDGSVFISELCPPRELAFDRDKVLGVYAVGLRGD
jgi:transcriptional regulator with XRE-family HTH domain